MGCPMNGEIRQRILNEDYIDLIIDYRNSPQLLRSFTDAVVHIMNDSYAIVYVPASQLMARNVAFRSSQIPNLFGLTDDTSLEASGVTEIRNLPLFNLRGQDILIAVIDTGIDYTNPVFLHQDGTTKIVSIWDQSIDTPGAAPYNTEFGTEYSQEQINQALQSQTPLEVVPSMDTVGHGTMMAAVAAGNEVEEESFSGVAPNSELIIVKVRQAKRALAEFYGIPENVVCFQENTLMWAVQYVSRKSREIGRPLVICLGCGTSQDSHDGRSPLSQFVDIIASFPNFVIVAPAGNEGNMGRHFYGVIDPSIGNTIVELNVGEGDSNFSMELWGNSPGIYSIDLLSPSGEYIPRIPAGLRVNRLITFIFEPTIINIDYYTVETQTGDQLIFMRFRNITPGIWRFTVYGQGDLATGFHIWLPMDEFITRDTYFIQPNIYTTVLAPGTAPTPITATAYNPLNNNLYVNSGRGYTRTNTIKPELAAPGVNYIAPTLEKTFKTYTGTSVAAAHLAGIAALLLEWGIVRGNQKGMNSVVVKNYLIRGAKRRPNLTYPNRDWGYGIVDLFNTFDILRSDTGGSQ